MEVIYALCCLNEKEKKKNKTFDYLDPKGGIF